MIIAVALSLEALPGGERGSAPRVTRWWPPRGGSTTASYERSATPKGRAPSAAVWVRHGLNLLAAELVASAVHHHATVALSSANVGRAWPAAFEAEGVELRLVD